MKRLFIDTTVAIFALGGPHPLQRPCAQVFATATAGNLHLHLSTEAIQEVLHHRMRRVDHETALAAARRLTVLCQIHDFDRAVLDRSLDLIANCSIRGRDAVHAATALEHGFTEIVSTDRDFDDVPGLTRIDPRDLDL